MLDGTQDTSTRHSATSVTVSGVNLTNPWANYPGGNPMPSFAASSGDWRVSPTTFHFSPNGSYVTIALGQLPPDVHEPVESEYPETDGKRLVIDCQLRWKQHDPHDQRRRHQPGRLSGTWSLHDPDRRRAGELFDCAPQRRISKTGASCLSKTRQQGQYYGRNMDTMDDGGTGEYEGLYLVCPEAAESRRDGCRPTTPGRTASAMFITGTPPRPGLRLRMIAGNSGATV